MPKNRLSTFKYCSRECKNKSNTIKIKARCAICGELFEHISSRCNKAKYCSRRCYHRSQINRGSAEYICKHCGNSFQDSPSKKRIYCSKGCVNKAEKAQFKPKYSTVRKKMLNLGKIEKCEMCSYNAVPEILGVHHKDGDRHNNILENLIVVCPMCHSLIHHKHVCH